MSTSKMMSWTSGRAHPNIRCDACGTAIVQVRYACLDCPDYDLCASCEDGPALGKHAQGKHVFAKVRDSRAVTVDAYRK